MSSLPSIALTLGDPAGIGPEIVLTSLLDAELAGQARFILAAPRAVFETAAATAGVRLTWETVGAADGDEGVLAASALRQGAAAVWRVRSGASAWLVAEPGTGLWSGASARIEPRPAALAEAVADLAAGRVPLVPGRVDPACGRIGYESIALAASLCLDPAGPCRVVATAPIHKEALRGAGVADIGHTEILGRLAGVADPLTMFETKGMRIFFHSRHVSLRKACDLVTPERVLASIRRCDEAMRGLGLSRRRLAVAGLNPHCGEHGMFGDEDDTGVAPAVAAAKAEGIDVHGPIGADSVFHQARMGDWDAVLSLYHDQGHVASKTYDFDRTIAVTLGLPFLRTSVDHGTAMDIAGRGIARAISMSEAMRVAVGYARGPSQAATLPR